MNSEIQADVLDTWMNKVLKLTASHPAIRPDGLIWET
jgi:hypothetical protein